MKKIMQSAGVLLAIYTGPTFAQHTTINNWTAADRGSFIAECLVNAKPVMGEDSARMYCYCMQEKVEQKYPSVIDASGITEEALNSPAWKNEIASCFLKPWNSGDRNDFLSNCQVEAGQSLSKERAKSYCECMLYKIEVAFPNSSTVTEEALQTEKWNKIAEACLKF